MDGSYLSTDLLKKVLEDSCNPNGINLKRLISAANEDLEQEVGNKFSQIN